MELQHIALDRLAVSDANMRGKGRTPDLSNILPSVRARGILVPLIVRPIGDSDGFEIIAGRRRYEAAKQVADECGEIDPLPCAIMEAGDDAAALETSLIENIARLDPDEAWRNLFEKLHKIRSRIALADYHGAIRINRVHLEHVLGYIQTNRCDLHLRSPSAANQQAIVPTPSPQPSHFISGGLRRSRSCGPPRRD